MDTEELRLPTGHLDRVGELYTVALLERRRQAGQDLSRADRVQLGRLNERLAGDDAGGLRRHRRQEVTIPAILKRCGRLAPALVLNMSAGGFLLSTTRALTVGNKLQVKLGSPEVEYYFPCVVQRVTRFGGMAHVAVSCCALALEIRNGAGRMAQLVVLAA